MAAPTNDTPGPAAPPQKKRPRLNPARRKSAKAQTASQNAAPGTLPPKSTQAPNHTQVTREENSDMSKAPTASQTIAKAAAQHKAGVSSSTKQTNALVRPLAPGNSNATPRKAHTEKAEESTKSGPLALAAPAMVTGGLAGCAAGAAVILGAGLWNRFGGTDSAILAARTAKLCLDNLIEEIITSLKTGTYSAPEALDMLRRTTLAYASTIPGGAPFVERLFREIDMVRRQRGREVDQVVAEAYTDLSKAGKRGASTAELHAIVIRNLVKLSTFAEKATQDIVTRNPNLSPFRDRAARVLQPPPKTKVPTVKLNMAVHHKPTAKA